jgi:Flp pilus assembly protein TadD
MMRRLNLSVLSVVSVLVLAGCATQQMPNPVDSMMGKKEATERRLSTAAAEAISEGRTEEALALYEDLHVKKPRDIDVALNYAQTLRKSRRAEEAAAVLAPFAETKDGKVDTKAAPIVLNEYAAALIELGRLEKAEEILDCVLENETAKDYHADAYNLMGIVMDASTRHREAESMFRMALETWKGNPTSVLNNLAMSLANQGMFDESLLTLRKALVMDPDNGDIARNIDFVSGLRANVVPSAPVDIKKKKKA